MSNHYKPQLEDLQPLVFSFGAWNLTVSKRWISLLDCIIRDEKETGNSYDDMFLSNRIA